MVYIEKIQNELKENEYKKALKKAKRKDGLSMGIDVLLIMAGMGLFFAGLSIMNHGTKITDTSKIIIEEFGGLFIMAISFIISSNVICMLIEQIERPCEEMVKRHYENIKRIVSDQVKCVTYENGLVVVQYKDGALQRSVHPAKTKMLREEEKEHEHEMKKVLLVKYDGLYVL